MPAPDDSSPRDPAPTGGYRQPPAEDRPHPSSADHRQRLGAFTLGSLGEISADLLLQGALELTLDRHQVSAQLSGGLTLHSARGLPSLVIYRLEAELHHLKLTLDADGAGPGLVRAAEIAGAAVLSDLGLHPAPGRSLLDPWLDRHPLDPRGRRVLMQAPLASPRRRKQKRRGRRLHLAARIDPAAELRLRLDRRALSITTTHPLALVVLGLHISLGAARYLFAERRLELEPARGLFGRLVLALAAFFLTRWLRRRLPPELAADGYDPWEDHARLEHLQRLLRDLSPPPAPASSAREGPAPTDSRALAARAPDLEAILARILQNMRASAPAPNTWQLLTIPLPRAAPPAPPPPLGPPETHAEASSTALPPGLIAAPAPSDPLSAATPPTAPAALTLALTEGAALHLLFGPDHLRIHAERGLFIQADAYPQLEGLRLFELRLPLGDGPVALEFQPSLGAAADAALALLVREQLLPQLPELRALLRGLRHEAGFWSVASATLDDGRELTLGAADGAQLEVFQRDGESEARISPPLTLTDLSEPTHHFLKLHGLTYRWRDPHRGASRGSLQLRSDPPAGPLAELIADRLFHRLAAAELAEARRVRLIPPAPPPSPPPPPLLGPVLDQRQLPQLGHLEVALARSYFVLLTLDSAGAASLDIEGGLHLRLRDLGVRVLLHGLALSLSDPPALRVHSDPPLGELESALALEFFLNKRLHRLRRWLWPSGGDDGALHLLLSLDTGAAGRLRLSLPKGAQLRLALDRQRLELLCDEGLHVAVDGLPWLPDLRLHQLSYILEDGAIDLRISGIVERYYHESECVSVVTEAILSHLVRVLVNPHLPERLAPLGLRRFPPLTPPAPHPEQIPLANLPIPGYGEALLAIDRGAVIVVTASEEELQITCERGFWIALPALFFEICVSSARYHPRSGEVQVGGLGQLENAILEAVIRQRLSQSSDGAPLADLLDRLPADRDGRRVLVERGPVRVTLPAMARFTLALSAEGIDFSSEPPIDLDGPGVLNYHLRGLRYDFARGAFALAIADDGVLASFFTGAIAEAVETRLSKLLLPMLPPPMRQPGYNLAADPSSAENLAAVVANALSRAPTPRT